MSPVVSMTFHPCRWCGSGRVFQVSPWGAVLLTKPLVSCPDCTLPDASLGRGCWDAEHVETRDGRPVLLDLSGNGNDIPLDGPNSPTIERDRLTYQDGRGCAMEDMEKELADAD